MQAIQYIKSVPRYAFVRSLGDFWPAMVTGGLSCIRLVDTPPPARPSESWTRVRTLLSGVCGSDLSTIRAKGSPYFSPLTSSPFVFGHEIVGLVSEIGEGDAGIAVGDRVVIEPALCCPVREIDPWCAQCVAGAFANCERVRQGRLSPGIQTGYCRDTGGGWSPEFVAHPFQIHRVPDPLSDEEAVLIEPFCCCLHAAIKASPEDDETVLIIGCGSIGLLTIAALRAIGSRCRILASARYPRQQELARQLGADVILKPGQKLYDAVCEETGAEYHQPEIGRPTMIGGVDATFDCVGDDRTLDDALRVTRSHGRVMVVGMPGIPSGIDWTALWHKELNVSGAYAYGTEYFQGERIRTFKLGLELIGQRKGWLEPLVTDRFRLNDYRKAIGKAMFAGRSGAVKVVFDFRKNGS